MKFIKESAHKLRGNVFLIENKDKTFTVAQCISPFYGEEVYDTFEQLEVAESYFNYLKD